MVGLTDLPEKVASALPLVAVIEVFSFRASMVALNPFLVEEINVVSLTVLSELRFRSALARLAVRTNPETLSESMVTDVACLLVELMTRSVTVWAATPTSAVPWASWICVPATSSTLLAMVTVLIVSALASTAITELAMLPSSTVTAPPASFRAIWASSTA